MPLPTSFAAVSSSSMGIMIIGGVNISRTQQSRKKIGLEIYDADTGNLRHNLPLPNEDGTHNFISGMISA